MSAVDELAVGDGWPGGSSADQQIGQIGDASAAIEAVVPLARIARQMLGADAVEGAVEPGLHVAEQDMDDGQHGIGVFAAVLDDRVVAEAVGEAVVALQTIGVATPRADVCRVRTSVTRFQINWDRDRLFLNRPCG